MTATRILIGIAAAVALCGVAFGAAETPVASKDGTTYSLEDLHVYWLRNLGKDGWLDFLQMMVIYQEGLAQGLQPTQGDINDFIDNTMGRDIYDEFKMLYSDGAVRQLVEYTIVTANYENWLRDKIRRENNITVTEAEANDYYLNNIDQFHLEQGVYLSIISVDNQTQANSVLSRLSSGESFNEIAGEVNMDPQMRALRGELGLYRRGDGLPEPLEEAAFTLQEGQYSDIIKGQNYHILYCHQHVPEVAPSFADIKEDLMLDLVEAKIDPYYVDALNELLDRELPRFTIMAELFRPEE